MRRAQGGPEAVLLLGKKLDFTIGFGGPGAINPETKLIHVDPEVAEIGRNRVVDIGIAGPIGPVLDGLAAAASQRA